MNGLTLLDWIGLSALLAMVAALGLIFGYGVWVDVIEPRILDWRRERHVRRLMAAEARRG